MAFLYPWGNTQQLNLDWILQKIKELEAGNIGPVLDEVANALISASYARQTYDRSDIVFYDGKLYRANQAIPAPGEVWTPAHWDEILLGDTVSNLVQYVAALSNDQIVNSSSVSGTHTSDALDTLKNAIDGISLDSDSVSNESRVTGDNVTGALDNLNSAISDEETARQNADTAIQNKLNAIGTILEAPASPVTVANGTVVEITSITLPTGNWIIFGSFIYTVSFSQAANGYIMIGNNIILTTRGTGINGGTFAPLVTSIANANNTTVTMKTYQESGSEKTAAPYYFRAIRIS